MIRTPPLGWPRTGLAAAMLHVGLIPRPAFPVQPDLAAPVHIDAEQRHDNVPRLRASIPVQSSSNSPELPHPRSRSRTDHRSIIACPCINFVPYSRYQRPGQREKGCQDEKKQAPRLREARNLEASSEEKSGRPDLNRGPHGPEPCALSELRYAPNTIEHYNRRVSFWQAEFAGRFSAPVDWFSGSPRFPLHTRSTET